MTTTYMVGFDELIEEMCNASNSIGKCGSPYNSENHELVTSDKVAIEVDISNALYGEDVIFDIGICACCSPRIYYLPKLKPTGELNRNLFYVCAVYIVTINTIFLYRVQAHSTYYVCGNCN